MTTILFSRLAGSGLRLFCCHCYWRLCPTILGQLLQAAPVRSHLIISLTDHVGLQLGSFCCVLVYFLTRFRMRRHILPPWESIVLAVYCYSFIFTLHIHTLTQPQSYNANTVLTAMPRALLRHSWANTIDGHRGTAFTMFCLF